MIRLRNALRPSSFPPPYPPPKSPLQPPSSPLLSPVLLPVPSFSGGSNGCGGICQAVTHPHGRILGYVFARSLSPVSTLIPFSLFPPLIPPPWFPPSSVFLPVRICIRSFVRPSYVVVVLFIFYSSRRRHHELTEKKLFLPRERREAFSCA